MKSGGDSVSPAKGSNPQVEAQERPDVGDYVSGSVQTTAGVALVGASAYQLATDADSTEGRLSWGGMAGMGTGFVLEGINFFRGNQDDATGRRLRFGSGYLITVGITTIAAGGIVDGLEEDEESEIYGSAFFAAVGLGMLGYFVYKDIQCGRQGKPGLLGSLVQNLVVGPNSVSTAAQF